jgi:hypothetical protein
MIGTYHNCHSMLADILMGLNDYSDARLQGSSTSGPFNNDWITSKINLAQNHIYNKLMQLSPEHFLSSCTLSFSSSVATLPWDFGKLYELKTDKGYQVYPSSPKILPVDNGIGSKYLFYRKGKTLVLNKSGVSSDYELWYFTKPRDLHQGQATDDNTLAAAGKLIADYYNGMVIEDVTGDWVDSVSDYTAARVVTMSSETLNDDDYYGLVSELPEAFHSLIAPYALILCKAEHPKVQKPETVTEIKLWDRMFNEALATWGPSIGESIEEIFTDYDTDPLYYNIPFPGDE